MFASLCLTYECGIIEGMKDELYDPAENVLDFIFRHHTHLFK